jgi:GDP-D-mannose dehydratase
VRKAPIARQYGYHLTKLLLTKDFKICALVNWRRNLKEDKFISNFPPFKLIHEDLVRFSSLCSDVKDSQPNEFSKLGAMK